MAKKIGLNVALGLNTTGFSRGLNRSKNDMKDFARDLKRQNEFVSKLGFGGFGRGFGIAGGGIEALASGGLGAQAAAVALPMAALAGTLAFMESVNTFRRDAVKHMERFNADMASGKVGQLVNEQMSGFAQLAAKQGAVAGPGFLETFMQSFASSSGGQNFSLGARGLAGGLGQVASSFVEDPIGTIGGLLTGATQERFTAGADLGMAQNTAQAQSAAAALALDEARKQSLLLERLANLFGGT